jgi:deoxyribonuclease V
MNEELFPEDENFKPYYALQDELRGKVIKTDQLPDPLRYVAGVDVAYNDLDLHMVGAIVVLDAQTFEVVDQAVHSMHITFPYMPGLFSFRELPPLLEAWKKLKIQPDLVVCDAHGIAHPQGVGMATHLGVTLDVPSIGCAKKRLIGYYDPAALGPARGSTQALRVNDEVIGMVLRTQDNIRPLFVSIGHKVSLDTAVSWVLRLCPEYRLPETTRKTDYLVNTVLKRNS